MRPVFLVLLPLGAFLVAMLLGAQTLGISDLAAILNDPEAPLARIILEWRVPRTLAGFCVGACLALSGVVFQGVFRNPLAEPYLLGSAGGAAVGASIALLVPLPLPTAIALPLLAFGGAWGATWSVVAVARSAGVENATGLLLAGVAIAAMLGAVRSLLLMILSDETVSLQAVLSWMLGGIQTPWWSELGLLAVLTVACLLACLSLAHNLDLLGLGDDVASSHGIDVPRFLRRAVVIGAAVTAVSVVWGGLIGFIGLIVPHLVRWTLGPLHARLMPVAALLGGSAVMLLDGVARSVLPPAEIPLGLLTALIGGPFFVLVLAREGRR